MGILTNTGGTADEVDGLLENIKDPHKHGSDKIIFSDDPKELVSKLVELVKKEKKYLNE